MVMNSFVPILALLGTLWFGKGWYERIRVELDDAGARRRWAHRLRAGQFLPFFTDRHYGAVDYQQVLTRVLDALDKLLGPLGHPRGLGFCIVLSIAYSTLFYVIPWLFVAPPEMPGPPLLPPGLTLSQRWFVVCGLALSFRLFWWSSSLSRWVARVAALLLATGVAFWLTVICGFMAFGARTVDVMQSDPLAVVGSFSSFIVVGISGAVCAARNLEHALVTACAFATAIFAVLVVYLLTAELSPLSTFTWFVVMPATAASLLRRSLRVNVIACILLAVPGLVLLALRSITPATVLFFVMWLLLPAINAGFDWPSWLVSRWLMRRLVKEGTVAHDRPLALLRVLCVHTGIDLACAFAFLVLLAAALPALVNWVVGWLPGEVEALQLVNSTGSGPLELTWLGGWYPGKATLVAIIDQTARDPWGRGQWVTLMLLSTFVPTVVHILAMLGVAATCQFPETVRMRHVELLELPSPGPDQLNTVARFLTRRFVVGLTASCLVTVILALPVWWMFQAIGGGLVEIALFSAHLSS